MESITSMPQFINCVFANNQAERGGAVSLVGQSTAQFEGCVFYENTADDGGAVFFEHADTSMVSRCTFANNHASVGAHLSVNTSMTDTLKVDHCLFAFATLAEGVFWDGEKNLELSCVDIFGNEGGDWVGAIADQEMTGGNLHLNPQFCGDANPLFPLSLAPGSPCAEKNSPDCGRIGALPVGCSSVAGADYHPPLASDFRLQPCFPNPFNPTTTISFELTYDAIVNLAIHDARGELVRTLVSGYYQAGISSKVWHGKDDHGQAVASGLYFARLTIGDQSDVRKMVLLR